MSDDHSSNGQGSKSWLDKLSQAFSGDPQTPKEILEILRTAAEQQILDGDSLGIIEGAMQVTDMQVREIMIPRSQTVMLKASQDPAEYVEEITESGHSRFPVLGETRDEVVGILLTKDLLPMALNNQLSKESVLDVLRPATFIPESKRLNQLLKEFRETRNHMAIVIDEYGGIAGMVTIEDVLEQIVGEIEDEHDFDDDSQIKAINDQEFIVKAITPIDDFNESFNTSFSDDEFDTVGGLVLKAFGRLPERGDETKIKGFHVKVLNADNRKIRLIQIRKLPAS